MAWAIFRVIKRLPDEVRARQIAGTDEDLLDLSEDVDPERDHIRGSDGRAGHAASSTGTTSARTAGRRRSVVRELLDSFGDDLRYVWRHLPLNDVHPNAQMAAEAAEAAGAQGAFWEMHDRLLDHQDQLDAGRPRALRGGARPRRRSLLGRPAPPRVRGRAWPRTSRARTRAASPARPSFFINGRRHQGAYDIETLTSAVRRARDTARVRSASRSAEPERVG